jgi:hypothetical protein
MLNKQINILNYNIKCLSARGSVSIFAGKNNKRRILDGSGKQANVTLKANFHFPQLFKELGDYEIGGCCMANKIFHNPEYGRLTFDTGRM